jgi:phage terminase small subunit
MLGASASCKVIGRARPPEDALRTCDNEASPPARAERPLRPRQVTFVQEYLKDKNATQAATRAGYSAKTARAIGHENLTKPNVGKAVEVGLADQMERLTLEADDVVRQWVAIARCDPNEFVSYRRVCCRYCYSPNGDYQETRAERVARRKAYDAGIKAWLRISDHGEIVALPEPFDELAGVPYDRRKEINPECTECFGDGEGHLIFKNTEKLSADAKAAFEGIFMGRWGPVVKAASRMRALDSIARHYGIFRDGDAGRLCRRCKDLAEADDGGPASALCAAYPSRPCTDPPIAGHPPCRLDAVIGA